MVQQLVYVGNISLQIAIAPIGKVYPTLQLVYRGSTVSIRCVSQRKAVWIKDGGYMQPNGREQNVIEIHEVKETDEGVYICIGVGDDLFVERSELIVTSESHCDVR